MDNQLKQLVEMQKHLVKICMVVMESRTYYVEI